MQRAAERLAAALGLFVILAAGCQAPQVDRLYAIRLDSAPLETNWKEGVPLKMKAGGGRVHGKKSALAGLDPETDPVHKASASCHHGPPVTDPVAVEARAFYDSENLYLEVRWEDPTPDTTPRRWVREEEVWKVTEDEGDGLAILWSRYPGEFGCQEACHVEDWTVRSGSLVDVRHMYLPGEGAWEEAWVWKAAGGTGELILGEAGFVTTEGERYRQVNSRIAEDSSLGPEIRSARAFGSGDGPAVVPEAEAVSAPAYLWGKKRRGALLEVRGERYDNGWGVIFTRPLHGGEGRQAFRPGEEYRFGLAVFDNTSLDHHIVRDAQIFRLVLPRQ